MKDGEFWKKRSKDYNKLNWVKDTSFLETFIKVGGFDKNDVVLDVGTGTGIIADAVLPLVNKVVGIDISPDMIKYTQSEKNKYFVCGDIRNTSFPNDYFDKITARMVFHHITEGTQEAANECYRLLKKGGSIILSEGIPPSNEVKDDYARIFKLKEERIVFSVEELVNLLESSGFKNIDATYHMIEGFSIKNWLENSGLSKDIQTKIFDLHINGSDVFKKSYNLVIDGDDCRIDIKKVILTGYK